MRNRFLTLPQMDLLGRLAQHGVSGFRAVHNAAGSVTEDRALSLARLLVSSPEALNECEQAVADARIEGVHGPRVDWHSVDPVLASHILEGGREECLLNRVDQVNLMPHRSVFMVRHMAAYRRSVPEICRRQGINTESADASLKLARERTGCTSSVQLLNYMYTYGFMTPGKKEPR